MSEGCPAATAEAETHTSALLDFLERDGFQYSEAPGGDPCLDRRPIDHPNPPRLPKAYSSAQDVQRWEGAWKAVDDISYCAFPGKLPVSANCSQVTPYIYLGNMLCASNVELLRSKGITHVLTLTKRVLPCEVTLHLDCKQIVIEDTPRTRIRDVWEECFEHIRHAKETGGAILVHCRAGVSRGSCCCMAYLMQYHDKTLREAYSHVKQCRPIVHPNKGFMKQLREHELALRGNLDGDVNYLDLPFTLWERVEHLGLSDPIPNLDLSLLTESMVAAEYQKRYGRKNPFMTMDAGLGGKMMLHSVELYWIGDFEWIDKMLVDVLYTNRPLNSNYVSRKHRKQMEKQAQVFFDEQHVDEQRAQERLIMSERRIAAAAPAAAVEGAPEQ
eukprot:Rhum_TRINITY_DN18605_c0_g1::Rhum_TRINITY_DN18605_c0_g1_i1::g.167855::m.167855/K14165/K14165; atypical dual specificity phosphatase